MSAGMPTPYPAYPSSEGHIGAREVSLLQLYHSGACLASCAFVSSGLIPGMMPQVLWAPHAVSGGVRGSVVLSCTAAGRAPAADFLLNPQPL